MKLKTKNLSPQATRRGEKLKTFLTLTLALFLSANAFALSDMKAKIKVSGGGTYDYFIIGMRADATDGFDNAYDTISPGPNMNNTYISTYFSHPEWNGVKSEYRADFRSLNIPQEWMVSVYTNLPAGTALTMALQSESSTISGYSLTVEDMETVQITDILSSTYGFTVSAGNPLRYFRITATSTEQPCTYTISPTSQSFGSSGGTGTVSVTASSSSCGWTASSSASWITITSGSSGTSNGTVNYSVAANSDTSLRIGAITIAGKTFTITQEGVPQVLQYTLTVTKSGTGSGTVTATGINCGTNCTGTYNSGSSVTLTAAAFSDSTFGGWSGACTGTSATCAVTMDAAKNVTASFTKTSISLTLTPPSNTTAFKGGAVGPFSVSITNNTSSFYSIYVAQYLYTPDGNWINMDYIPITLSAGQTLSANNLYLWIPPFAPAGTHYYLTYVFDSSWNALDYDYFTFTVTPSSSFKSGSAHQDWHMSGWPGK